MRKRQRSTTAQTGPFLEQAEAIAFLESLRSPRNSLGKLALPKGLMEYAVEDSWDGATEIDEMYGLEIHHLGQLADLIVTNLQERLRKESAA